MSVHRFHARMLIRWLYTGMEALRAGCGGEGLATGCPRCGKVWGS